SQSVRFPGTLASPAAGWTANRTVRLPDLTGILALKNAAQTWTALQTFDGDTINPPIIIQGNGNTPVDFMRLNDTDTGFYMAIRIGAATLTANRNCTFPDGSGQIVLALATQTLSNKVLSTTANTLRCF